MLATIVDPGYKFALFLHILAVVLAFGPTFGYALFFSVAPQFPRATPAILAGVQKCDRYLVNPGMIVLLLAGIYLLSMAIGRRSEAFISVGFLAIFVLFGLQHGFFQPKTRKARELAERDLKTGDVLSDEFNAVSDRIGKVGGACRPDRRRDDLLHVVQALPLGAGPDGPTRQRQLDPSLPIAMFDSGRRRPHRPARVPGLAARGGLRLPRRHAPGSPTGPRTPSELRERIARDRRATCSAAAPSCS